MFSKDPQTVGKKLAERIQKELGTFEPVPFEVLPSGGVRRVRFGLDYKLPGKREAYLTVSVIKQTALSGSFPGNLLYRAHLSAPITGKTSLVAVGNDVGGSYIKAVGDFEGDPATSERLNNNKDMWVANFSPISSAYYGNFSLKTECRLEIVPSPSGSIVTLNTLMVPSSSGMESKHKFLPDAFLSLADSLEAALGGPSVKTQLYEQQQSTLRSEQKGSGAVPLSAPSGVEHTPSTKAVGLKPLVFGAAALVLLFTLLAYLFLSRGTTSQDGANNQNYNAEGKTTKQQWTEIQVLPPPKYLIVAAAFSKNNTVVALSTFDDPTREGEITLWDVSSGKLKQRWPVKVEFNNIDFSPDGKLLVIGGGTFLNVPHEVSVWDIEKGKVLWRAELPSPMGRTPVVFSPDGMTVWGGSGKVIKGWDAQTGNEVYEIKESEVEQNVESIALSPDGTLLSFGEATGGRLIIWDIKANKPKLKLNVNIAPNAPIDSISFSREGKWLACAYGFSNAPQVKVFDISTGQVYREYKRNDVGNLNQVRFAPTGNKLISVSDRVYMDDITDGTHSSSEGINSDRVIISPDTSKAIGWVIKTGNLKQEKTTLWNIIL